MRIKIMLLLPAVLSGAAPALADDGIMEEFLGYYSQRIEGVTAGAGNAKEANSAIQALDPWPAYSWNRNIPANGERMSRAIRRYQDVTKLPEAARAPLPESGETGFSGNGGTSAGR